MTAATGFLERRFRLTERRTSVRAEVLGGLATFLTMSYILFVNPAILSGLVMAGYLMTASSRTSTGRGRATSIPAFLTIAGIPLTFSIAAGIGLGVLSCCCRRCRCCRRAGAGGAESNRCR